MRPNVKGDFQEVLPCGIARAVGDATRLKAEQAEFGGRVRDESQDAAGVGGVAHVVTGNPSDTAQNQGSTPQPVLPAPTTARGSTRIAPGR